MRINKLNIKISNIVILIAAVSFVLVAPRITAGYFMMVVNMGLIFAIAAFGVCVMLGIGGQLSFATVSFMGFGAYFVANLTSGRMGIIMGSIPVIILMIIATTVVAFSIGLVLFKLKSAYFTFATIGLVQVSWSFYLSYVPLFGGPDGISRIATFDIFGFRAEDFHQWFYILVVFVLIVVFLVERIKCTQLGRSLAAIRDNEIAAQTLGINIYMTKVIAFTIAGVLAAFAGALYAMHSQFVSADMFTFERTTTYIIMAMLGGVNNTKGVLVGSMLVTLLPEWLRGMQQYLQLIFGVSVILLMVFMPMGLAGLVTSVGKRLKRKLHVNKKLATSTGMEAKR